MAIIDAASCWVGYTIIREPREDNQLTSLCNSAFNTAMKIITFVCRHLSLSNSFFVVKPKAFVRFPISAAMKKPKEGNL